MADKIFWHYVITDILFIMTGGLLITFGLVTQSNDKKTPTAGNIETNLLLEQCPLTAAIANAILIFLTFLISIPAMVMPTTRGWLKFHGYMVVVCALFTLVIGLDIWFTTLKIRHNLSVVWDNQPASSQSLLQQKFNCCGYNNSTSPPFAVDSTCPDAGVAASLGGCISAFTKNANNFLDIVFTGAFGIVGIDAALVFATVILLKDRKEKIRYRHIDEKNGAGSF